MRQVTFLLQRLETFSLSLSGPCFGPEQEVTKTRKVLRFPTAKPSNPPSGDDQQGASAGISNVMTKAQEAVQVCSFTVPCVCYINMQLRLAEPDSQSRLCWEKIK